MVTYKKKVAIYVRVSTSDQNTELQENELTQYSTSRNWEIFEIYADKKTGTSSRRENLQRLLNDVRHRKVDIVLCWKLDRLFRSLKDLVITLQEFNDLGVQFISLKDNIDLTTHMGRLMCHLLGAFAEFEASLIKERVKAGIENARNKGKVLGRPKLGIEEKALSLREGGMSLRKIANELNVSLGTVQNALKRCTKNLPKND